MTTKIPPPFEKALRRTGLRFGLTGTIALPTGVIMVWLTFFPMQFLPRWAGRVMGVALALAGVLFLYKSALYLIRRLNPPRRLMEEVPGDLVWIYTSGPRGRERSVKGEITLFLATNKGRRMPLLVPAEGLDELIEWLRSRSPGVVMGWDVDREKRFRKNPEGLSEES